MGRQLASQELRYRLARIAHRVGSHGRASDMAGQRNRWTRWLDRVFTLARRYVPPLHWMGAIAAALGLWIYAWLVVLTVRLTPVGGRPWPDLPAQCVLATRHGLGSVPARRDRCSTPQRPHCDPRVTGRPRRQPSSTVPPDGIARDPGRQPASGLERAGRAGSRDRARSLRPDHGGWPWSSTGGQAGCRRVGAGVRASHGTHRCQLSSGHYRVAQVGCGPQSGSVRLARHRRAGRVSLPRTPPTSRKPGGGSRRPSMGPAGRPSGRWASSLRWSFETYGLPTSCWASIECPTGEVGTGSERS